MSNIIFDAMDEIDDEFVEEAERAFYKKKTRKLNRVLVLAASMGLLIIGVGLAVHFTGDKNDLYDAYDSFAAALACRDNEINTTQNPRLVPVNDMLAMYEEENINGFGMTDSDTIVDIEAASQKNLGKYVGELLFELNGNNWYSVNGFEGIYYLIKETKFNQLSLWRFSGFKTIGEESIGKDYPDTRIGPYNYEIVLDYVYKVSKAADIDYVEILPAKKDNTFSGQEIRNSLDPIIIKDKSEISRFYEIIKNMECYKEGEPLENIDRLSEITQAGDSESMALRFRDIYFVKNINIYLKNGNIIKNLIYDGTRGEFYEEGVAFYRKLTKEDMRYVDILTGIDEYMK